MPFGKIRIAPLLFVICLLVASIAWGLPSVRATLNRNGLTAKPMNRPAHNETSGHTGLLAGANAATLTVSVPTALGNYANTSVTAGGSTTVTPDAAPTNTTSATASAPGFIGLLSVNPTTGVVSVMDAVVAGTYTVTVKAFGGGGSVTKTFIESSQPETTSTSQLQKKR